jgi:colanic acid/amylovoran biosynthesis glycosyltransferase
MSTSFLIENRDPSLPALAVYCDLLLGASMTFVRAQAEALTQFVPYYVGTRSVSRGGLHLPKERTLVINRSGSSLGKVLEVPFKVFGYDPTFFRRARRIDPVLVHAHFGDSAVVALPLVERLGAPLIVTFHGADATVRQEHAGKSHFTFRLYWRKREVLKRRTALFIAVSEFIRDKLLESGYPQEKIWVHYIGIDTKFFRAERSLPRRPVVLFVARLEEKKGCEYAIRAMELVQQTNPEWELAVIGDGTLRADLHRLARERLHSVRFLGMQPQSVVREWMNQASLFCVPSIVAKDGDAEGFGLVFAEAQAMGLPVVSFAAGGVPEAVAHSETGFLAPERDWEALAKYIKLLIDRPDLWLRMSEAGRRRIERHFDLRSQTRKLESVYFAELEKRKGAHLICR